MVHLSQLCRLMVPGRWRVRVTPNFRLVCWPTRQGAIAFLRGAPRRPGTHLLDVRRRGRRYGRVGLGLGLGGRCRSALGAVVPAVALGGHVASARPGPCGQRHLARRRLRQRTRGPRRFRCFRRRGAKPCSPLTQTGPSGAVGCAPRLGGSLEKGSRRPTHHRGCEVDLAGRRVHLGLGRTGTWHVRHGVSGSGVRCDAGGWWYALGLEQWRCLGQGVGRPFTTHDDSRRHHELHCCRGGASRELPRLLRVHRSAGLGSRQGLDPHSRRWRRRGLFQRLLPFHAWCWWIQRSGPTWQPGSSHVGCRHRRGKFKRGADGAAEQGCLRRGARRRPPLCPAHAGRSPRVGRRQPNVGSPRALHEVPGRPPAEAHQAHSTVELRRVRRQEVGTVATPLQRLRLQLLQELLCHQKLGVERRGFGTRGELRSRIRGRGEDGYG
mmetsp:Transcript_16820/g.58677  ORF Transcript_16820/g.58677 Transcript_16820/m.58677 type:complete len:437 (+) Transcript_16820:650-1960(+)